MLIPTHKRIANKIYDELGSKFQRYVSRHAFIDGNIKPDIDTSFTRSHYYEKAFHYVLKEISDVRNNRFSRKEMGIKLGVICHFIADFSITYHSNTTYRAKSKIQHFNYERRIDDLIKNLSIYSSDFNRSIYHNLDDVQSMFELYMEDLQSKKARPRDDLIRAMSNCYHLMRLLINEYATDDLIDHSGLRVAIFTDTFFSYGSGISNAIYQMISYYDLNGIPYILISPNYKDTAYQYQGMNTELLKSMRFSFSPVSKFSITRKKKLRKSLDEFNPTVIQVMTVFNMGRYGVKYGIKNEIPVFTNFSTDFPKYFEYYKMGMSTQLVWRYLRKLYAKSVTTFTPSYATAKYLNENGINNVSVFSRGVDTTRFNSSHYDQTFVEKWNIKDKFAFLYVGRLSEKKDLTTLFKAYNQLHDKYPEKVSLVIVGDGPRKRKYQKLASDSVIFPGFIENDLLPSAYASCDAFVTPSSIETYSNAILEAMASSLPVIAVNQGGVTDAVQDGYNGLLVEPKNVLQLFEALETVLINKEQNKVLSDNALTFAKSMSWKFVFENLEMYYKKYLD